jgi:hypothetical protein
MSKITKSFDCISKIKTDYVFNETEKFDCILEIKTDYVFKDNEEFFDTKEQRKVTTFLDGSKRVKETSNLGTLTIDYDENGRKKYCSIITKFGNVFEHYFEYDNKLE